MRAIFLRCSRDRISQWTCFLLLSLDNNKVTNPKPQASFCLHIPNPWMVGMHQPTQLFYMGAGSSPACMASTMMTLPSPLSHIGTSYVLMLTSRLLSELCFTIPLCITQGSSWQRVIPDFEEFPHEKEVGNEETPVLSASSRVEKNACLLFRKHRKTFNMWTALSYRWKRRVYEVVLLCD